MHVVISIVHNGHQFLIVRRRKPDGLLNWHFPSGKKRKAESAPKAAERETLEETGVICKAVKTLGDRVHPDTKVKVSYWICEYVSGVPTPNPTEIKDLRWASGRQVIKAFTSDVYGPLAKYLGSASSTSLDRRD